MGVQEKKFLHDSSLPLKVANYLNSAYDWASFTLATATTDYDVKANQSALFKYVPVAHGVIIWANKDISVKFNDTKYAAIAHGVDYEPHEWIDKLRITNIYITNVSGSTATIKIFLI